MFKIDLTLLDKPQHTCCMIYFMENPRCLTMCTKICQARSEFTNYYLNRDRLTRTVLVCNK